MYTVKALGQRAKGSCFFVFLMLVSLPSRSNRPPVTKFRVCNGSICTRRERVKVRIAWSRLSVQNHFQSAFARHVSMHTKRTGATGFPISIQFVPHFAVRMSSRHQLCFSITKMSPEEVAQGGLRSSGGFSHQSTIHRFGHWFPNTFTTDPPSH